jgi:hypothetical protein
VVVYANTSAAVKARADWVVTSSCALEIVEHLMDNGETIIWAPDQHLGRYIQRETGADMLLWDGACIVHEEFKAKQLGHEGAVPGRRDSGAPGVAGSGDRAGRCRGLHQSADQGRADLPNKT